ncbi:hypothetical protein PAPYR_1971 [Paratrimastix pyriformis]|uniref:PSI domain-containing protein n=1 Tax=Paratrimastix pyriformis TaxID=342808 RepID=A0ABQ8USA2_9EUKA|nr:hypothetical protein PAPYR_1971 [Paratrimastix pyriformis]|eukprot:GAFH01001496.1.p1 GENE.GAFH01001496.1~~GAFH01001496.1.p1  ORF type:complete len:398 (-),score=73.45 GAFH01001496.1:371-1564(-)
MKLVFFALLAATVLAGCEQNQDCKTCAASGCGWCGATQTCMVANGTCPNCMKTSTASCPASTCSHLTSCAACGTAGCTWCADTNVCRESDSTGAICEQGTANCVKCSRDAKSPCYPTASTSTCSAITDCATCTLNGCGWCPASGKCLDYDHNDRQKPFCGQDKCQSCVHYLPTQCPAKTCSSQTTCRDCSTAGCAWCSSSQTCMEYDPILKQECLPTTPCTKCLKTAPTTCPSDVCSQMTSCSTCSVAGCIWCNTTSQCFEATPDLSEPCSAAQCYYGFTSDCGCSQLSSGCRDCTAFKEEAGGCGWCDLGESLNGTCLFGTLHNHFGKCVSQIPTVTAKWNYTTELCYVKQTLPHWFQGVAFVGMFFLTGTIFGAWFLIIFCNWYRHTRFHSALGA